MPFNEESYECDDCGREIECAFYYRDDGESTWKSSADDMPNEPDHVICASCHRTRR